VDVGGGVSVGDAVTRVVHTHPQFQNKDNNETINEEEL
jgi:hypothetical protein